MRWYHFVFLISLQLFINILFIMWIWSQIKVVSFMQVSSVGVDSFVKELQGGEDPEKLKFKHMQRLREFEAKIAKEKGIVLLKECVVKGPFRDITNELLK